MKRKLVFTIAVLVSALLSSFIIIEETFIEGLKTKLWGYIQEHPTTNLHVHTDKNIYSPTEKIWFKAYVLAGSVTDNKVLYIRVADEAKHIVAKSRVSCV